MSGSTIGGVVGGAIGFYFGGPQGAQIGWMIGSAVGGYVDPDKIQGPRLTDAVRQTAQAGVPITFGYGTFPTTGNIIWVQPGAPTEHKTQERTGKGGPVQITYTYTRSYAIGICEGEITGLLVIKRNGKVVYDARSDAVLSAAGMTAAQISASRAASAAFITKCTIYTGSETQLPDSTIEAWQGVGNVPGHRGLAYIVVHDDDVTELHGAIPQYEFVVAKSGTVSETCGDEANLVYWYPLDDAAAGGVAREVITGADGVYSAGVTGGLPLSFGSSGSAYFSDFGQYMVADGFPVAQLADFTTGWSVSCWLKPTDTDGANVGGAAKKQAAGYVSADFALGGKSWEIALRFPSSGESIHLTPRVAMNSASGFETALTAAAPMGLNSKAYVVMTWEKNPGDGLGTLRMYVNGVLVDEALNIGGGGGNGEFIMAGGGYSYPESYQFIGYVENIKGYDAALTPEQVAEKYITAEAADLIELPDAPGWYMRPDGTLLNTCSDQVDTNAIPLSEIVADLFARVGIPAANYDVSDLASISVTGYRIASEGGVDAYVAPLMQAYFFDVGEWDGKLRCVRRGQPATLALTTDDLAEKEGDAIEQTRVQEAELLRKVTVGYIDPAANYTTFTQEWERRSATIEAKGEGTVQVPVVMAGDDAAMVAEKRGKVAWSETDKFKFCLPYRRAKVTPTDVVTLYDFDGEPHRVRVMGVEEDSGVLHIEGARDRQAAYIGTALGVAPTPITPTGAPLIGPTRLVVMNLPVLRDADDAVGLYVAGRGYFSGWAGGQVQVSTDGGVSYSGVAEITQSSTIGYTTTAFAAGSAEVTDTQSLTVWLPDAPESVDYATLLRYANRAAIQSDSGAWEIVQYQAVVANGDNSYTLSGIIRGRYDTTPGAAAAGATFVLIDSTLQFVQTERWMVGQTLQVRAVSYGTDPDAAGTESFAFTSAVSQTEWSPVELSGSRDGSDNVTVSWVGRARLGTEVSPHQSQYFDGYRVTYSDGVDSFTYDVERTPLIVLGSSVIKAEVTTHEYTAAMQTSDFGSVPGSLTVTVSALNLITGESAPSDSITV